MRDLDFLRVAVDDFELCPYLPDQIARMPLCLPTKEVTPERMDQLLEAGYRRSGFFFYRTRCPFCQACEPLRLDAARFVPSRSQRRAWKRGQQLTVRFAAPKVDEERVRLFNQHRRTRGLAQRDTTVSETDYRNFLLNAPGEVIELSLWQGNRLIGVSITDIGRRALSAVYCYFDPAAEHYSPGTLAILHQIELAREQDFEWVYLGLYVAANRHLNYKARYLPHQRLQQGSWRDFHRGGEKREFPRETG